MQWHLLYHILKLQTQSVINKDDNNIQFPIKIDNNNTLLFYGYPIIKESNKINSKVYRNKVKFDPIYIE